MDNVFSKHSVTKKVRMYATEDNKQRYFGEDTSYFISYRIRMNKDHYTICGANGTAFYSYAVLDMYDATIEAGFCKGEFIQVDRTERTKYIEVCGFVSDLENLMVLDDTKEAVGPSPAYKPCDDDQGGGGGSSSSATLLANDFEYDGDVTYTITSFANSFIDEASDLPNDFVVYVSKVEKIVAGAKISLFHDTYDVQMVDGSAIEEDIESIPRVLPLLFNKASKKVRMLYAYIDTRYGFVDLFLDLDKEEQTETP